jgi:hypothetical protein
MVSLKVGDMVRIVEEPWSVHAGDLVFVRKIDEDGLGFDFVIPESRGHAPAHFVERVISNFDLKKLGVK